MKSLFVLVFFFAILAHGDVSTKPNILLILTDDHSWPHAGHLGDPNIKTPNLDDFAAEGLSFDRAYVTSPQCTPSRSTILTGRSPIGIGMARFSAALPADVQTFPERLRAEANYFTGFAGRGHHLDGSGAQSPETRAVFDKEKLRTMHRRVDVVWGTGDGKESVAQFQRFLDRVPKGDPFFLQLGFTEPHRPLDEQSDYDPDSLVLPPHYPDTPELRADLARYYSELTRFDRYFGEVMAELEKRGLDENTLVIFMGDNGAALLRGKGTLYEYGVRVPLVMRWPGVIAPDGSTDILVSGEDIAPTCLEVAGLTPAKDLPGHSLMPIMEGDETSLREYAFAERGSHSDYLPVGSDIFDISRMVVDDRYKLIYNVTWQLPYRPTDFHWLPAWKTLADRHKAGKLESRFSDIYFPDRRPMFELYDLQNDPAEMTNLVGQESSAEIEHRLKTALNTWMIHERDYAPTPLPPR